MIDREPPAGDLARPAGRDLASLPPVQRGCAIALERCLQLIGEVDDASFVAPSSDHGTIGAHLRHCIEYFRCFLGERETGVIEYDAREREVALETDRTLSRRAIEALLDEIAARRDEELGRTVTILQSLAPGAAPESVPSTVHREWMSLSDHTIHHLAIITQLVAAHADSGRAVEVASRLGVAFSTQAHRDRSGVSTPGPDRT